MILQWKYGMTNKETADYMGIAQSTFQQRKSCDDGKVLRQTLKNVEKDNDKLITIIAADQGVRALTDAITCKDMLMYGEQWEAAAKVNFKILELLGHPKKSLINIEGEDNNYIINVMNVEKFDSSPKVETSFELLNGPD